MENQVKAQGNKAPVREPEVDIIKGASDTGHIQAMQANAAAGSTGSGTRQDDTQRQPLPGTAPSGEDTTPPAEAQGAPLVRGT